jgi:hypothetical protein
MAARSLRRLLSSTAECSKRSFPRRYPQVLSWPLVVAVSLWLGSRVYGQSASTGAVTGIVLDPSGPVVPGVFVHLTAAAVEPGFNFWHRTHSRKPWIVTVRMSTGLPPTIHCRSGIKTRLPSHGDAQASIALSGLCSVQHGSSLAPLVSFIGPCLEAGTWLQ